MAISVAQLQKYMDAGFNILITGQAGTGKTAMLKQAARNINATMKYYSASTLDPFADLVGIPTVDEKNDSLKYYRPRDVDQAEVIFFDELNRADTKTLNAVFELIQFKSINGEPLPKLKCVVAAINPVEEQYATEELDLALMDRFDFFLESEVTADYTYLKQKFGQDYARAGVSLFQDYQKSYTSTLKSPKNKLGYFSPRRLEKLMDAFMKFPDVGTIAAVLPADVQVAKPKVAQDFKLALGLVGNASTSRTNSANYNEAMIRHQLDKHPSAMRSKSNAPAFFRAYKAAQAEDNSANVNKLRLALATALASRVGPETVAEVWGQAVKDFSPTQLTVMKHSWPMHKREQLQTAMAKI